jgi:hypothetical protein
VWRPKFDDGRQEAEQLATLILARLTPEPSPESEPTPESVVTGSGSAENPGTAGTPEVEPHESFLEYQFVGHFKDYRKRAGSYGLAFTLLSITVIGTSLFSSGIAAGWSHTSWARWVILLFSLAAGIAAGVNQFWRPGEKSASRTRGASTLSYEGWNFVEDRGRYRLAKSDGDAFGLFVDEVLRVVQETAAVDEGHVQGSHTRRGRK